MKNIDKIILDTYELFNFKNPTLDKLFFKKKKKLFYLRHIIFFISTHYY